MSVAALYDIHGNLPALEAVLADIRGLDVTQIVVGGDIFPGPLAGAALDCLLRSDIPMQFLRGNGDRAVLAELTESKMALPDDVRLSVAWNAQGLRPEQNREMASWPATLRINVDGWGNVLFCHATPENDTDIFTRLTPEADILPVFADANASLVVCGHTHMQFDRMVGDTRVVNAGSVGMPFQDAGAYWLLLDAGTVELRRTLYDFEDAAARIRSSGYPQAEFAAQLVLQPPTEAETLERFSRVQLKRKA